MASGFSDLINCLIRSALPYPSTGYKNIDESVNPVLVFVSLDKSNLCPCCWCLIAPPTFIHVTYFILNV